MAQKQWLGNQGMTGADMPEIKRGGSSTFNVEFGLRKALDTFERHKEAIICRWDSLLTNARLEGLNSLFQAAMARSHGYRNTSTSITMIYLIAAPVKELLFPLQESTRFVEEPLCKV